MVPSILAKPQPLHIRCALAWNTVALSLLANCSGRDSKPIGYRLGGAAGPHRKPHPHSTIREQQQLGHVSLPKKWSFTPRIVPRRQPIAAVPTASNTEVCCNKYLCQSTSRCSLLISLLSAIRLSTPDRRYGTQHYTEVVPSWCSRTQSNMVCQ